MRFEADREWWVSPSHLARACKSAMASGELPADAARWLQIAHANGGLDFALEQPDAGSTVAAGLLRAAKRELVAAAWDSTDDGLRYATSLRNLLRLFGDVSGDPLHARSCLSGQACAREGFWSTPAKPGSRHHFATGAVMPVTDSDCGAAVWQWDEDQTP